MPSTDVARLESFKLLLGAEFVCLLNEFISKPEADVETVGMNLPSFEYDVDWEKEFALWKRQP